MPRFPVARYRDVIKVAKKLGFSFYRMAKGDHEVWGRSTDNRVAVIPHHAKDFKRKTLGAILKSLQISPKEFLRLKASRRRKGR